MPDYFRFVFLFGLPPCFLVILVFGSLLFWCAYWSSYSTSYSWAFLDRASEGMIGTGIVVSLIQGFRDSQDFASSLHLFSTSTTSPKLPVSPSPLQYDGWHTFASFPSSKGPARPPPWPSFPTRLFPLLCKCFLVHMWFYNLVLRCQGFCWDVWKLHTCKTAAPSSTLADKTVPLVRPKKPSSRKARNGPLIGGRSLAMFLSVFCDLGGVAPFHLASQKDLSQTLRKYRCYQGQLQSDKLPPMELERLRTQLKSTSDTMMCYAQDTLGVSTHNMLSAVVDSGCSFTTFNSFQWVDPSSIRKLASPIRIGGIAGGLDIEYFGTANLEVLLPNGKVQPFPIQGLISESLPQALISPQAFLAQCVRGRRELTAEEYVQHCRHIEEHGSPTEFEQHFRIFHNRSEWHKDGQKLLDLKYDSSYLPRITLFRKGTSMSTAKGLFSAFQNEASGTAEGMPPLTLPSNQNLSVHKKLLLLWHSRLGHIGLGRVLEFAMKGLLSNEAKKLHPNVVGHNPLCGSCIYGKQTRKPDGTTITSKNPATTGNLLKNNLNPGDCVFSDQLESSVRGRLFHTAGREPDKDRYCGATVFVDAASSYIHTELQVTFNASDTIVAKDNFEKELDHLGVTVKSYHTDNGIYVSKAFTEQIANHNQKLRLSGVGAKWQNGRAEGAIGMLSNMTRTSMIHAALHWPEQHDPANWSLCLRHNTWLYNHTPNRESGIAPIELLTGTKNDFRALRQARVWGSPCYMLEPRLTQAGHKIPKWKPRSRRGQFMGISPGHAENISLVKNFKSGYLSPAYHVIHDDSFETVYSPEGVEPPQWEHLCVFERFELEFESNPPALSDDWLTTDEILLKRASRHLQSLKQGRKLWQDTATKESREDFNYQPPKPSQPREVPSVVLRESPKHPTPPVSPTNKPGSLVRTPPLEPPRESPIPVSPEAPARRYPLRESRGQGVSRMQIDPSKKSYDDGPPKHKSNLSRFMPLSMFAALVATQSPTGMTPIAAHLLQAQARGFDPMTCQQESFHPGLLQSPMALVQNPMSFKAKSAHDPDLPTLRESLCGPHAEQFWTAMDAEIASLEKKGTWTVVDRSSMPAGMKAIPGTFAQRIKRLPTGELSKFKSRWCCRGDLMRESYTGEIYAPLVGWPTVRTGLVLAAAHGWKSRQVDFTLAFCQSPQPEDQPLYMELPQYYRPKGMEDRDVVLKMNKSIYGQLSSPRLFWEHLSKGMDKLGFDSCESDPCCFVHRNLPIMVLNYCDDQIWLSPDNGLIEEHVDKLQKLGYDLTLEDDGDIFGFLGINIHRPDGGSKVILSQAGLIKKIINYTGMQEATSRETPAVTEPLGSDKDGEPFDEEWSYPAVIGMLLYLSSNTRPDLQFALHAVSRHTHAPKKSHGQAVKRIIRYLIGTQDKGIEFVPDLKQGLDCWVDASFAGLWGHECPQDPASVKSHTGFTLTLFGCPILSHSKAQTVVALSSTAAEYVALSEAMRELLPLRRLLLEISTKLKLPTISQTLVKSTVFEDNQSCLALANAPKLMPGNKYLALRYHFFRSEIGPHKGILVKWVSTENQLGDLFTKALGPAQFKVLRKKLMGW